MLQISSRRIAFRTHVIPTKPNLMKKTEPIF